MVVGEGEGKERRGERRGEEEEETQRRGECQLPKDVKGVVYSSS